MGLLMTILGFFRMGKQLPRLRRTAAAPKIVRTRAGVSIPRPVALARTEPRRPGLATRRLTEAFFDPLPVDELAAWEQ
jgi:hypothetical protein